MSVYTNPPEWEAQGKKPPSSKRTEGWKPGDRVPASWLNWFWFSTVNSLREIAQAFVNHRDASAPHDGHETKEGATAKVEEHSQKTTAVHGVEAGFFVAKTSRPDQRVGWQDIVDKPSEYPPVVHDHDDRYYTKAAIDQMLQSSSSVAVITGVASHGELIPLPPGYSEDQCHILVSIRHLEFRGWDRDTVRSITCYVDEQRRLFCRATDFRGREINGTANYMVIGIK